MPNRKINTNKHVLRTILAFAATAIMLTLAQQPISWWPLAWVAYVPFILVCFSETKPAKIYLVAFIVSTCYWLGNIYWMSFVTVVGWIAFCLYTALLWPLLAISLRWCMKKRFPLFIAVPVLIVGIEQMQGLFLGGFYWNYLAHSQYANTTLIQIADIFGAAGVSFVVAMVNGLVAEIIMSTVVRRASCVLRPTDAIRNTQYAILATTIVIVAVIGTVVYGHWRINQSAQFVTQGPLIGAVQTNIPISVKKSFVAEKQIFDELLEQSSQCISANAKLVVWPETMVQAILNPQVLRLLVDDHQYKIFDEAIREHAKKGRIYLPGHTTARRDTTQITSGWRRNLTPLFCISPTEARRLKSTRKYISYPSAKCCRSPISRWFASCS